MATKMAASLVVPNNGFAIAGQKFTCSLTLTESGGTNTNFVSIQPFGYLGGGAAGSQAIASNIRFGTVANAATIGAYAGGTIAILANTSVIFNYDAVIDGPSAPVGVPSQADASYYISAICQTSDGSVFQPPPVCVTLSQPSTGASTSSPAPNETTAASVILGTSRLQYTNVSGPGQLRFDIPTNLGLLL